jgi:hypothetical protein
VGEVFTPYYARPEGSASKLSTWRDGLRILGTIETAARLLFHARPCTGSRFGHLRDSDLRHLLRGRLSSAPSNSGAFDWAHAAGFSVHRHRSCARYGDQGAARSETPRVPAAASAGRGLGFEEKQLAVIVDRELDIVRSLANQDNTATPGSSWRAQAFGPYWPSCSR